MENKHIILIGAVIIIIIFLTSLFLFSTINNATQYKNFTCNDTGTVFEVPKDLKVRQDISNYGIRSSMMSTPNGDIVIERQVGDNPYIDDTMEGASQLLNSYDGDNVNGVEIHSYSRTAKNEATGEVILVSSNTGDNETVDHIINSIKWGNKTVNVSNQEKTNTIKIHDNTLHNNSNNDELIGDEADYYSNDDYYYDDEDYSYTKSSYVETTTDAPSSGSSDVESAGE